MALPCPLGTGKSLTFVRPLVGKLNSGRSGSDIGSTGIAGTAKAPTPAHSDTPARLEIARCTASRGQSFGVRSGGGRSLEAGISWKRWRRIEGSEGDAKPRQSDGTAHDLRSGARDCGGVEGSTGRGLTTGSSGREECRCCAQLKSHQDQCRGHHRRLVRAPLNRVVRRQASHAYRHSHIRYTRWVGSGRDGRVVRGSAPAGKIPCR